MVTKPTTISKFKFHSEYYFSVHANILWLEKHFAEVSGCNNMHIVGDKYELDSTTVRNKRCCYLDVSYELRSTKVDTVVTIQPKCWIFSSAAHSNSASAPSTKCLQSTSAIRTSGNCLWIFRTLNFLVCLRNNKKCCSSPCIHPVCYLSTLSSSKRNNFCFFLTTIWKAYILLMLRQVTCTSRPKCCLVLRWRGFTQKTVNTISVFDTGWDN